MRPGSPIRGRGHDDRVRIRISEVNQLAAGSGLPSPSCVCPAWARTRGGSSPPCETECIMKYPFNEVVIRSTSQGQLRKGDRPWEGRLGDSHGPMNKNLIRGRRSQVSWHNTAKPFGSAPEVNEAVVWWRFVPLPGEISLAWRPASAGSASGSNVRGDQREVSRGHSTRIGTGGLKDVRLNRVNPQAA